MTRATGPAPGHRPTVVCMCGSTRFFDTFRALRLSETLEGRIVLTVGSDTQSDAELFAHLTPTELRETLERLSGLHFAKIDLADEILVLNVGGYLGEHTRAEVAYARAQGKRVRWLEPESVG